MQKDTNMTRFEFFNSFLSNSGQTVSFLTKNTKTFCEQRKVQPAALKESLKRLYYWYFPIEH